MYQAIPQSQEKLQTNLKTPLNIIFDQSYYSSCTPTQKRILQYMQTFRFNDLRIRHKTIAAAIGCTPKTVQRATDKFMADGVLTKSQINRFSPNNYEWESDAFSICQPEYTEKKEACPSEYVQQIKYIRSIYKEQVPVTGCACARTGGKLPGTEPGLALKCNLNRTVTCANDKQRGRTVEADEAKLQELRKDLNTYFDLTPVEEFALMVFPYDVLQAVYNELQSFLKRKQGGILYDSYKWFITRCKKHCEANNIIPEWRVFYDNCRLMGLDPKEKSKPRPVTVPPDSGRPPRATSDNTRRQTVPASKAYREPVFPIDDLIKKVDHAIESSIQVLADPNHPNRPTGPKALLLGFTSEAFDASLKAAVLRDYKVREELYRLKALGITESPLIYSQFAEENVFDPAKLCQILNIRTQEKIIERVEDEDKNVHNQSAPDTLGKSTPQR